MPEAAKAAPEPTIEDRIGAFLAPAPAADPEKEGTATSTPEATADSPVEGSEAADSTQPEDSSDAASDSKGDEAASDATPAEGEDEGLQTLEELAGAFDVTTDVLTSRIKVKGPDGSDVPLADAISAFQDAPAAIKASEAAQARTKELEADGAQLRQEHDAKLGELQQLTSRILTEIEQQPEINWKELEEEDPAEFAKQKVKQQERHALARAGLEAMKAEAEKRDKDEATVREEWRQEQVVALQTAMPEWKDPAVAKQAMEDLGAYLEKSGFATDEVQGGALEDHRYLITAWKAAQYDKLQAGIKLQSKKVRTAPKIVPGGARTAQASPKTKRYQQLRAQLKKSGKESDAAALFEEAI